MKTRTGFVSNSSSSSFVASLDRLSLDDIGKLFAYEKSDENVDGWQMHVDHERGLVVGYTSMDNDAFGEWCEKQGFNKIRFEGGGY